MLLFLDSSIFSLQSLQWIKRSEKWKGERKLFYWASGKERRSFSSQHHFSIHRVRYKDFFSRSRDFLFWCSIFNLHKFSPTQNTLLESDHDSRFISRYLLLLLLILVFSFISFLLNLWKWSRKQMKRTVSCTHFTMIVKKVYGTSWWRRKRNFSFKWKTSVIFHLVNARVWRKILSH